MERFAWTGKIKPGMQAEYKRLSAAGVAFKSPPSPGDAAMPAMSLSFAITRLWPITFTAIVPACLRVMVNCVQVAGTVIESASYCMASLLVIVVAQSPTVAGLLPVATGAASTGAVSTGAGVAAVSVAGAATGGSAEGAGDWPQAERARASALATRTWRDFIVGTPLARQVRRNASHRPAAEPRMP